MGPHILVVGGTGMLAGLVEALAGDGGRLSLLSRQASQAARPGVIGYDCDYHSEAAFAQALEAAVQAAGPVTLGVAWFHTLKIAAPRRLAEQVRGRLFQVLGSAAADPARPDRLGTAAAVAAGLPECRLRQVVLGFRVGDGRSRWLTDEEISDGVLKAVREDLPYSVVGEVSPWSARP